MPHFEIKANTLLYYYHRKNKTRRWDKASSHGVFIIQCHRLGKRFKSFQQDVGQAFKIMYLYMFLSKYQISYKDYNILCTTRLWINALLYTYCLFVYIRTWLPKLMAYIARITGMLGHNIVHLTGNRRHYIPNGIAFINSV